MVTFVWVNHEIIRLCAVLIETINVRCLDILTNVPTSRRYLISKYILLCPSSTQLSSALAARCAAPGAARWSPLLATHDSE